MNLLPINSLEEFKDALQADRVSALRWLMSRKLDQWSQDGQSEIIRCLVCWAEQGLNLGDDLTLIDLAIGVLD